MHHWSLIYGLVLLPNSASWTPGSRSIGRLVGVLVHKLTHGTTERCQQEMIRSYVGVSPVLSPGVNCEYRKDSFTFQTVQHLVPNLPFLHCVTSKFL